MESCAFTYDGGTMAVAHIVNADPGIQYRFNVSDNTSSAVNSTATGSTLDITVTGIGGVAANTPLQVRVNRTANGSFVGTSVVQFGVAGEYAFDATWSYDGANTVTVDFLSVLGLDYRVITADASGAATGNSGVIAGTGALLSIPTVAPGDFFDGFYARLDSFGTDDNLADRLFHQGIGGAGLFGNPLVGTGAVKVTLDGSDVTSYALTGSWTRRLNRPATAQIRCPMELVSAAVGTPLKIEALISGSWQLVHHGHVLLCETDTAEDGGYTVYNSTDPMELWQWRPVRDNDCDFTQPLILQEYTTGPLVLEAALNNSIDCGDGSQADCEGDLFLTVNAAAGGGVDLSGAPTDWPMTIAELASLLISTGEVDVVITPTDPGGGIMGTVDFYNGDYGTDRSADIIFSYGMGDFNVRRLRWNQDMTSMVNKLWYYGGPRIATAADPAAVQHWCWNITGDDPGLVYPPGGENSPPASGTNNQLGVLRVSSKTAYGVRMDIQIFDAYDDDCIPGIGTPGRNLYRRRWQQESWLRAVPREIIHVTPTRETEIGTFDVGDLVGVEAVAAVRGGFSGAQRVYEYTVSWDNDGVLELSELQTSADNEGL